MKIKNFMSVATVLSLSLALAACGSNTQKPADDKAKEDTKVEEKADDANKDDSKVEDTNKDDTKKDDSKDQPKESENDTAKKVTPKGDVVSVTMVTDEGGVNDKSFNQSAFEGLTQYADDGKAKFDYIESHQDADYQPNLESALDSDSDIILTVGFALYQETQKAAEANPEQSYVIIDNDNVDNQENLLGVRFADNENSFLAGYIAGMKTETDHVGFIGGQVSDVIDRFEYGFRAGVKQASREKGKDIKVDVQYANSFVDQAAGKNIANQMYQSGADVVMHAAGGVGIGVNEAAKENNKWVIGVDRDQSDEAPDNMLVSTIKGVGHAVQLIIDDYAKGSFKGGQTQLFTLADGSAVDIAYAKNDLVSKEVKDKVEDLRQQIIDGKIEVPQNKDEFESMGYDAK